MCSLSFSFSFSFSLPVKSAWSSAEVSHTHTHKKNPPPPPKLFLRHWPQNWTNPNKTKCSQKKINTWLVRVRAHARGRELAVPHPCRAPVLVEWLCEIRVVWFILVDFWHELYIWVTNGIWGDESSWVHFGWFFLYPGGKINWTDGLVQWAVLFPSACRSATKLYVSFAEYSLFYMALLQKRPITLRSLLIVSRYGVATISRLPKNIGRICKRTL